MDISKALSILEFESLDDITDDKLTKAYRKLMRQHHPDLFHHDEKLLKEHEKYAKLINEAHEILGSILKQIDSIRQWEALTHKEEIFAIIPFQSLFDMYNGKVVKLHSGGGSNDVFELNKSNIRTNRIILCIECCIIHNNVTHQFSTLKPAIISDEYNIDCEIPVIDDKLVEDIKIEAYEKNISIQLKNSTTILKLRYTSGVTLTLNIRKRIIDNAKEEKG